MLGGIFKTTLWLLAAISMTKLVAWVDAGLMIALGLFPEQ